MFFPFPKTKFYNVIVTGSNRIILLGTSSCYNLNNKDKNVNIRHLFLIFILYSIASMNIFIICHFQAATCSQYIGASGRSGPPKVVASAQKFSLCALGGPGPPDHDSGGSESIMKQDR